MNTKITLDSGRSLDVEFEIEPASGDGWNSPRSGEHIEIVSVSSGWRPAQMTDAEDVEILAHLWRDHLQIRDDRHRVNRLLRYSF